MFFIFILLILCNIFRRKICIRRTCWGYLVVVNQWPVIRKAFAPSSPVILWKANTVIQMKTTLDILLLIFCIFWRSLLFLLLFVAFSSSFCYSPSSLLQIADENTRLTSSYVDSHSLRVKIKLLGHIYRDLYGRDAFISSEIYILVTAIFGHQFSNPDLKDGRTIIRKIL